MLCPTVLSPFIRAMGGGYLVGSVEVPHLLGKKYTLEVNETRNCLVTDILLNIRKPAEWNRKR